MKLNFDINKILLSLTIFYIIASTVCYGYSNIENNETLTGSLVETSKVIKPRMGQDGILLKNGEVLITGGIQEEPYIFAEIYNPLTNTFREPKNNIKYGEPDGQRVLDNDMNNHSSILLDDGRVLLIGRRFDRKSQMIYNPTSETFSEIENSSKLYLSYPSVIKLRDNSILIIDNGISYRFYPDTNEFKKLNFPDDTVKFGKKRTLIELSDGNIIIFGSGNRNSKYTADLPINKVYKFDIKTNDFSCIGSLIDDREEAVNALKIDDENILVWGGANKDAISVQTIEKYNIKTNTSKIIGELKGQTILGINPVKLNDNLLITGSFRWSSSNKDYIKLEVYDIKANKSFFIDKHIKAYTPIKLIKLNNESILILCGREYSKHALAYFSKYAYRFILKDN